MVKKNLVHNFVRLRWVELYLAPGNWSGLFRTGFFSGFRLLWTSTALPLGFLSGPGFLGEFLGDS